MKQLFMLPFIVLLLLNNACSGIIRLQQKNGILVGHRDIILGKNIPDYPKGS